MKQIMVAVITSAVMGLWMIGPITDWAFGQTRTLVSADLAGTYGVTGQAPNGAYTATMEILPHGPVFEVRWTFPRGDYMEGVGFLRDGVLVVGYEPAGVIVYRRVQDAPLILDGQWTAYGFSELYTERATKGPAAIHAVR